MTNYKNKYIKYKLKYLKLKQTGGCFPPMCVPGKEEEEEEEEKNRDDIITVNGVIYIDGGDPRSNELSINKNKPIMDSIDKFFKDFKDDEIEYFYEIDKIMYAGSELTNESDLSIEDMEDEAVINIHLKLKKIKCSVCGHEDNINSHDYIYNYNKKVYVHHLIDKCYNYIEGKHYDTNEDKTKDIIKILQKHGEIAPGYADAMFSYYNDALDREKKIKKNKYVKSKSI